MAESYISTIASRERRFLGGTNVYTSNNVTINYPNNFDFSYAINLQLPQPEISRVDAVVNGVAGTDEEGIIYGGNFKVKRNLLNNTPSITISGNLTENQKNIIKSSISIFESFQDASTINTLSINTNLLQLSAYNLSTYTVTIPLQDVTVTIPDSLSSIPFLSIDAANAGSTYDNPISVTIGNKQLIIDAGNLIRTVPTLLMSKNWSTTRNITVATVDYDPGLNNNITVSYTEDLNNVEGLRFRAVNIPNLNVPNQANYCLQVDTRLYNHAASIAVDPLRYDDSSTTRRLAYRIQYGVGKVVNGSVQPAKLLDYAVRAKNACTAVFDDTKCVINCDDTGVLARNAFNIINYTGRIIPSVEFRIDRNNSANNYFTVNDPIFNTPYTYRGFSNDMYLEDFASAIKELLNANQTLRWEDGVNRGMPIVVLSTYNYAKISDISNFTILQFDYRSVSNLYRVYSVPSKAASSFAETFTYSVDGSTLQDFRNWFLDKFGSFGVNFTWNIPYIDGNTDFTSFSINPIVIKSGSFTQDIGMGSASYNGSIFSQINCFLDITSASSVYEETVSSSAVVKFDTGTYSTVATVAEYLTNELNDIITSAWISGVTYPEILSIQVDVANSIYSQTNSQNYIAFEQASTSIIQSFTYNSNPYTNFNGVSTTRSSGVSLNASFSRINLQSVINDSISISLNPLGSIGALVDDINSIDNDYYNLVQASLSDSNYSSLLQNTLQAVDNYDLKNNETLTFLSRARIPFITRYNLLNYATLAQLESQIETDYAGVIDVVVDNNSINFIDAVPSNLQDATIGDIRTSAGILYGEVSDVFDSYAPTYNLTINYDIDFATTGGGDPDANNGLQVAIGGYEKDGIFYPYDAPNAFFEPNYNTLFKVEFNTVEADLVYILVRTRKTTNSTDNYSINPSCYTGLARYSNGYTAHNLQFYTPTQYEFTSVWSESFGLPAVVAVPLYGSKTEINIEDICTLETLSVSVVNKPAAFDQIGFLAINKTNDRFSQSESKVGTVYGLVLDNRGAWDVLVSPESILKSSSSGTILYGNKSFTREILDDDEGFDMSITSLDTAFAPYIKLLPLPNNPQVWILQIDPNVKRILRTRRANVTATSLNGCSVDVNFSITGRTTRVTGNAKVTIFYDYTCVYDIGLCDYYWNLVDPPQTKTTQVIQNRIDVSYETLIDCQAINQPSDNNLQMKVPVLVSLSNIPTFVNGNALLLIKSIYNSNIQNYYFPTANELDVLQKADCSPLNTNIPLISRLNKEFLFLPNVDLPITDSSTISSRLITETSYLYVRPQFRFPPDDNIKDCDPNEIVIVGIGYQFKNWRNGYRSDDVVIGLDLLFSSGVYVSPSIDICCRYYYNQNET